MSKLIRRIILLLSLSGFVISVWQLSHYWDYETVMVDIGAELRRTVTPATLRAEIVQAIEKKEFSDARMYLAIARNHAYPLDYAQYEKQISEQDTHLHKVGRQISQFASGFANGKSTSSAGIAGAVSADFTVVGDARDLYREYGYYRDGKPVNELIVALSGAGIGLTALSVSSLGSAIPVKSGLSLVKLAAKTGRLTARFQKLLLKQGRRVFDWATFTRLARQSEKSASALRRIPDAARKAYHPEAIAPLKSVASRVNRIRRASSVADTVHLMKYVDSAKDLQRLEKVTLKYGIQTRGIMKLLGKGALRTVKVLKKTTALLISLVSTLLSAMLSLFLFFTGQFSGLGRRLFFHY